MQILKILLVLAFLFPTAALAYTYNQKQCSQIADRVNKTLPMNVDQATQLVSSACSVISGKATFTYNYELNFTPTVKLPKDFKGKVINKFCSNPETREFLDGLSLLHMDYYLQNGTFYDRIQFSNANCD